MFILACGASADVYVKMNIHTDAFSIMGQSQPAKDETAEQWIGDDKLAYITPESSVLIDLKKNIILMINHPEKTYVEAALPFDFASLLPAEMAQMMSSMMKMTVTVNPTGQTKKVGQWDCTGYEVTVSMMMPMKMTVWASSEVPFDVNKFAEKFYPTLLKAQLRMDDTSIQEFMKIKGFMISSEMSMEMMGAKMRSTTEVLEITKKNPGPEVYAVPAGYTKQDKLSMKDLQKR